MASSSDPDTTTSSKLPLSTEEAIALKQFKEKCIELDLLDTVVEDREDEVRDGIDDDATLIRHRRWLRSRRLNVQAALQQFQNAYQARQVNHVSDFYENIEVKDYEETQRIYPRWVGRCDKGGLPIFTFDLSKLDSKTMASYRKSSLKLPHPSSASPKAPGIVTMEQLRSFAFFDWLTRFVMPLLSAVPGRPDPHKPVTRILVIADITGLTMTQLWNLRGYAADFGKLLANNYPEILDRGLIVGAPPYFSAIWRWVKVWFDPVTVSKLEILSPDQVLPVMKTYMDVANIPKRFGGELEHEHGSEPLLDPAIHEMLTWLPSANRALPIGPLKWINGEEGCRVAIAVGKNGDESRGDKFAVLSPQKT